MIVISVPIVPIFAAKYNCDKGHRLSTVADTNQQGGREGDIYIVNNYILVTILYL